MQYYCAFVNGYVFVVQGQFTSSAKHFLNRKQSHHCAGKSYEEKECITYVHPSSLCPLIVLVVRAIVY